MEGQKNFRLQTNSNRSPPGSPPSTTCQIVPYIRITTIVGGVLIWVTLYRFSKYLEMEILPRIISKYTA